MCIFKSKFTLQLILCAAIFYCQASYSAVAPPKRGKCNKAITFAEIQSLDFGNFLAGTSGRVFIATDGTRTSTGNIILMGGTPTNAIFEVNSSLAGCDYYPLKIKGKVSTLTETGGATMTVRAFVTNPPTGATLFAGTPLIIQVGAKLVPVADQTPGLYNTTVGYDLVLRHLNP